MLRHARNILFCVLLAGLVACGADRSSDPMNVVLITLDTTRADRFGCYGCEVDNTPAFDRLAAEGIRFDAAIAQAAVTPVSHASIMTGLYPYQHGVRVFYAASGYHLDQAIPTIATVLQDEGWSTGAFLSAFPVSEYFGFENGFDHFDNGTQMATDHLMRRAPTGVFVWNVAENQRRSDVTTDAALEWLEKSNGPFFTWIHYWDPHDDDLKPPDELLSERPVEGNTAEERKRSLYDIELSYVDRQFGRLVEGLKELGFWENTIVVVVADHGEGLGDHGWFHHRLLYQEQIRVPLILRVPGGPAGRTVDGIVRTIDIFPTVLEALQLEAPGFVEGKSMIALASGRREEARFAYADQLNAFDTNSNLVKRRPDDGLLYCVTDGEWKLIYRPEIPDKSELFHLASDPAELVNLYESNGDQAERLRAILDESGGYVDEAFGESTDDELRKRLEALGYVD